MQELANQTALSAGIVLGAGTIVFLLVRSNEKRKARVRRLLEEAEKRPSPHAK